MLPQIVVFQCFPVWLSHDGKGWSGSVSQCTGQGYQGWPARKEGGSLLSQLTTLLGVVMTTIICEFNYPNFYTWEEEEETVTKQSRWSELSIWLSSVHTGLVLQKAARSITIDNSQGLHCYCCETDFIFVFFPEVRSNISWKWPSPVYIAKLWMAHAGKGSNIFSKQQLF